MVSARQTKINTQQINLLHCVNIINDPLLSRAMYWAQVQLVDVMTLNLQDGQMRFQATHLNYLVAVQG